MIMVTVLVFYKKNVHGTGGETGRGPLECTAREKVQVIC